MGVTAEMIKKSAGHKPDKVMSIDVTTLCEPYKKMNYKFFV